MEKKDWKKTKWKLNAIAVEYNLTERIDKIEEELEGLLDKAREEGKREGRMEKFKETEHMKLHKKVFYEPRTRIIGEVK